MHELPFLIYNKVIHIHYFTIAFFCILYSTIFFPHKYAFNMITLLQLSPVHPAYTAPDFDSAEAACNADGARLWQPRNVDALNSILKMHGSYLGSMTTAAHLDWISDSSEVSFTAVGLKARSIYK